MQPAALKFRWGHDVARTAINLQFNACRIQFPWTPSLRNLLITDSLQPFLTPDDSGISAANVGDVNKLY
jgi:hypothetical protein